MIKSFTLPYIQAKAKHDMYFLAFECYYQYGQAMLANPRTICASTSLGANVVIGKDHKLYNGQWVGGEDRKLLNEYLVRYFGLTVRDQEAVGRNGSWFVIKPKD